jgi:hypothetical protein
MPEAVIEMKRYKFEVKQVDRPIIRIIGILLIGVLMPLIFYEDSDPNGRFKWILASILITFIEWETSRRIVSFLWKRYPWENKAVIHLLVNILFLILLTTFSVLIIYLFNLLYDSVMENYWYRMRGVHLSVVLLTLFAISVYEGVYLFYKWKRSLVQSALLEKENILSQYEALKNQVNPHFLFNSLNTLAGIIPENSDKAIEFVTSFSSLYRYVLDVKDLVSVKLEKELEFVRSYIYMQKIRYGETLQVDMNPGELNLNSRIMPLSLQLLIENAIKHNEISDLYPLKIRVSCEEGYLVVRNALNKIPHELDSPKTGLHNLKERYRLVSDSLPYFHQDEKEFVAGIPLLPDV